MTRNFNNRTLAASQQVYGWLLRAYPPAHRAEYGPAMAQLFRDQSRDAWSEAQDWGMIKLWLRVLPDLVDTSIRERIATLNKRKTMNDKLTSLTRDRTTPTAIFVRVFVVVFLITLLIASAITFILPESYASTCRILVRQIQNATNAPSYDPYSTQTQLEIINSEAVLAPAIDKLNLNVAWGKKYFNGQTLKTSETVEILKGRLGLAPIGNTMIMAITVYSDDRNEAAMIANAVAESYRIFVESDIRDRAQRVEKDYPLANLRTQITALQKKVEDLRQQCNVSKDASGPQSAQEQPYWDAKQDLMNCEEAFKKQFDGLQKARVSEVTRPGAISNIAVIETATPGRAPVRPNKPLNIFLGAVAGGFLGLVAGGLSALVSSKLGNRGRKTIAST
jgi:capsular polysaccharide biosynthesis protein